MDLARADAMLFYDDCQPELDSPNNLEGSEDEDTQQELEEMLYSRVYHDSSSIDHPFSVPENCPVLDVNITQISPENQEAKIECRTIEPTTSSSAFRAPKNCFKSQFNNPSRSTASRYYDVQGFNPEVNFPRPLFVAPVNPGQKTHMQKGVKRKQSITASALSNELLARSSNEQSYLLEAPVKTNYEQNSINISAKTSSVPSQDFSGGEDLSNITPALKKNVSAKPNAEQGLETLGINLKSTPHKPSETSAVSHLVQNEVICNKLKNVQLDKITPPTPTRSLKTNKLQNFEAKVSKVLSSMLDEESRSSLEENQLTSLCSAEDLNHDSGWSVGMSWADMSSKYSFGVDSIEEESVSSLQLHDTSFTADSRTNTPDIQTQLASNDDNKNESENELNEQSRYAIQLKTNSAKSRTDTSYFQTQPNNDSDKSESEVESGEPSRYELKLKDNFEISEKTIFNPTDTDSESEVGSIVEVAPPVKPQPLLVDLSDGEYAPAECHSKVVEVCDNSSDDDIVVLDVIDTSTSRNMPPQKGHKRQSDSHCDSSSCADEIPLKRPFQPQVICSGEESVGEKKSPKTHLSGTSTPKKMHRLEQWLHDPIKASKYLDHKKDLTKMSGDPSLWKLCRADVEKKSPRGLKCPNCKEYGHKARKCRVPKKIISCHMCGQPGHTESNCKEKMCLRCGMKNNIFIDRCRNCTNISIQCKICSAQTHTWKTCPDLWRRYHLTTSDGNLTQPTSRDIRPRSEQWCSNCARNGHLSHECNQPHWRCEIISPFIQSYANIGVEENKFEGIQTFSLMLEDEAALELDTEQGKELLKSLSVECQVEIHASLDITYKKLCMKGSTLAIEEVRSRVMKWTSRKEVLSRNARLALEAPSKSLSLPTEAASKITSEIPSKNGGQAAVKTLKYISETSPKIVSKSLTTNVSETSAQNDCASSVKKVIEDSTKNAGTISARNASLLPKAPSKDASPSAAEPEQTETQNVVLCQTGNAKVPCTPISSKVKKIKKPMVKAVATPPLLVTLPQKNVRRDSHLGTTICDAWDLPRVIPKEFKSLENFLENQMNFINKPFYCNHTLRQIYEKALEGNKNDSPNYMRILKIVLLGKCGFEDGPIHVAALKDLLQQVKERKGQIKDLHRKVNKSYRALFGGAWRNDLESLLELFYSDETLVKKFDGVNDFTSFNIEEKNKVGRSSRNPKQVLATVKKYTKKVLRQKKHNLSSAERLLRAMVSFVVKNLSSRFILSSERTLLENVYSSFCNEDPQSKEKNISRVLEVIRKLCRKYCIMLPSNGRFLDEML